MHINSLHIYRYVNLITLQHLGVLVDKPIEVVQLGCLLETRVM